MMVQVRTPDDDEEAERIRAAVAAGAGMSLATWIDQHIGIEADDELIEAVKLAIEGHQMLADAPPLDLESLVRRILQWRDSTR